MPVFRLRFHLKRTLTCFVEAETESDIDDFMLENPSFSPIDDYPEMIEEDETSFDEEDEHGDYEIIPDDDNVDAMYVITPGLELLEIED